MVKDILGINFLHAILASISKNADSSGLLVSARKEKEDGKVGENKTGRNPVFECFYDLSH